MRGGQSDHKIAKRFIARITSLFTKNKSEPKQLLNGEDYEKIMFPIVYSEWGIIGSHTTSRWVEESNAINGFQSIGGQLRSTNRNNVVSVDSDDSDGTDDVLARAEINFYNQTGNTSVAVGGAVPIANPDTSFLSVINPSVPSRPIDGMNVEFKEIQPVDVVNELKIQPTHFNLMNIDEKLKSLEYRKQFVQNRYASYDINHMIDALNNRKRYMEFAPFFSLIDVTDRDKIDELLRKYPHLRMGQPDLFIGQLPEVATLAMQSYDEVCDKLNGKKPNYYIIARQEDFKQEARKKDPILIAQSPFGLYFYIIGAWGIDDMKYLSEL